MNTSSSPRQTRSFLMKRFEDVGLHPKTKYGQNFLIDLNLLEVLADAAQLSENDIALEVGGGTGGLTTLLAQKAKHVVSVEIDYQLAALAREALANYPNVTLLLQDALKNKNRLHPNVMAAVQQHLEEDPQRQFKLVANLPYNVATPIISNLVVDEPIPTSMTVTIQKELADRMIAAPGSKDYGALSIWLQSQCDIEIVRIMPPTVFWPRPKVHSAIVHLEFRPDLRARIADIPFFQHFVRSMFFHRRKYLRGVLVSAFKGQLLKDDVDQLMDLLGYTADARAEQLDVEQMLALCDTFQRAVQGEV